jgi:hypothetical protein
MKAITPEMEASMAAIGFTRRKARWLGGNDNLPRGAFVQQHPRGGLHYSIDLVWGYPDRDPYEWSCLNTNQRQWAGFEQPYYNVADEAGIMEMERHFLELTVPTLSQVTNAEQLMSRVLAGSMTHEPGVSDAFQISRSAIDISDAHGLDIPWPFLENLISEAWSNDDARQQLEELALFRPALGPHLPKGGPVSKRRWPRIRRSSH